MKYITSQKTNNKVDREASAEFCGGVLEESGMEVFWRRCEGLSVLWWRKLDPVAFIRDTSGSKNTTGNRQLTTTAKLSAHRPGTQGGVNLNSWSLVWYYTDMGKDKQSNTQSVEMNILVLNVSIIVQVIDLKNWNCNIVHLPHKQNQEAVRIYDTMWDHCKWICKFLFVRTAAELCSFPGWVDHMF